MVVTFDGGRMGDCHTVREDMLPVECRFCEGGTYGGGLECVVRVWRCVRRGVPFGLVGREFGLCGLGTRF